MSQIWALPREKLFEQGHWNGLNTKDLEVYHKHFSEHGIFRERDELENDRAFKQIVGQVILQVNSKFLIHKITPKGGESRLHEMWPMFLGGHIEEFDRDSEGDIIMNALDREFHEEVKYHGNILQKNPLAYSHSKMRIL